MWMETLKRRRCYWWNNESIANAIEEEVEHEEVVAVVFDDGKIYKATQKK